MPKTGPDSYRKREPRAFKFDSRKDPANIVDFVNRFAGLGTAYSSTYEIGSKTYWNLYVYEYRNSPDGNHTGVPSGAYVYTYGYAYWRVMNGDEWEEEYERIPDDED